MSFIKSYLDRVVESMKKKEEGEVEDPEYYAIIHGVYMYMRKKKKIIFKGYECFEWEHNGIYVVSTRRHQYFCVKHYNQRLLPYLSSACRCLENYRSGGKAFFIYVEPTAVESIIKHTGPEKLYKEEQVVREKYPLLRHALNYAFKKMEKNRKGRGSVDVFIIDGAESLDVSRLYVCPVSYFIYMLVDEGVIYIVYSGK